MQLTNEQIQAILDGAQSAHSVYDAADDQYLYAYGQEKNHLLSDLREILHLRQDNKKLTEFIRRYRYQIRGGDATQAYIDANILTKNGGDL